MLKMLAALSLTSALVFAPVVAFADESTTPPSPDSVKTPGNGPDMKPMPMMHHKHHMKHTMPMKHHTMKKPMMDKPADAPKS